MHELSTLNVQMRLITSDTIGANEKISSVNFSEILNNIDEVEVIPSKNNGLEEKEEDGEYKYEIKKTGPKRKAPQDLVSNGLWNKMIENEGTLFSSIIINNWEDPSESYTLDELLKVGLILLSLEIISPLSVTKFFVVIKSFYNKTNHVTRFSKLEPIICYTNLTTIFRKERFV